MLRWLTRTPVQTFILSPLAVIAVELVLHGGKPVFVPWGGLLLAWGYLQYRLVGRYRLRLGGGGPGMQAPPQRIVTQGPYRYVRNPMYLGHLIFLAGLAMASTTFIPSQRILRTELKSILNLNIVTINQIHESQDFRIGKNAINAFHEHIWKPRCTLNVDKKKRLGITKSAKRFRTPSHSRIQQSQITPNISG